MPNHTNPVVKSLSEGKVKKMPDGSYKRVMPRRTRQTSNKPGLGSTSKYVAETRRRRAIDAENKRLVKKRNKIAKLAGSFGNTTY